MNTIIRQFASYLSILQFLCALINCGKGIKGISVISLPVNFIPLVSRAKNKLCSGCGLIS